MTNAAKAAKRAYMREWYKNNRDRVKAYNDRYWAKRAAAEKPAQPEERSKPE